jgi:hypothetical protein
MRPPSRSLRRLDNQHFPLTSHPLLRLETFVSDRSQEHFPGVRKAFVSSRVRCDRATKK